jgi:hypothetical protein
MRNLFLFPIALGFGISAIAATPMPATGPAAVEAFLQAHESELANSPQRRAELDALCRQMDCDASRLFWYTDLEEAKAAAKTSGKPILSLRLLGQLDADLSCANSRFFRVALYPNAEVSQLLRDRFILHWQSVRPVPLVTVDFGDGRTLERTLTGNSIHYVLSPDGQPIEALPGLYGPGAFLRQLQQAEQAVKDYAATPEAERDSFLQAYHQQRLNDLQQRWTNDLQALGVSLPDLALQTGAGDGNPTAIEAGQVAMTKMVIELPLLTSMFPDNVQTQTALTEITDRETWEKLAAQYAEDARLDANSRQLVQRKKGIQTEAQLQPTIASFEASMALDGIRNEYLLHSQLHQWFALGIDTADVNALNERVYAELFLTPSSDPWLGLIAPDSFSGINGEGIRE